MKKKVNLLPADSYIVINKSDLDLYDRKVISKLYEPIIGHLATSLYYTFLDDLDENTIMSREFTHHHIMAKMRTSLKEVEESRDLLEGIGLLKTYRKNNSINEYIYVLYAPVTATDFFTHPILNVVLYNNIGKTEYSKLINLFKTPNISLKDYEDITHSFDQVFNSVPSNSIEQENIFSKSKAKIKVLSDIDFDLLESSMPDNLLNNKGLSDGDKELINNLSFTYNLDTMTMVGLIKDSLNEKGLIDKKVLRKSARDYYQFDNGGRLPTLIYSRQPNYLKKPDGDASNWAKMVYTFENTTPYNYLKSKYKGNEPTSRDLMLIESLLVDQKLTPGVVNVLISYVLKVNNEKLNKNYIETIVGQWKRLNIETVEEAMKEIEKEHKKKRKFTSNKKVTKKQDVVPEWFDKEINKNNLTEDEEGEISKLLEDLSD